MRRQIAVLLIGVASALALATPAEAAEDSAAAPTSTVVVAGPATTLPDVDDDDDDDSDKTGLWGLLGLLGLAGLAGLAKKRDDPHYTTSTPVSGTAPPRADGATGSR